MGTARLQPAGRSTLGAPFLPLGVYWPGELTFQGDADRWSKIDSLLSDLQADGINTVWLTHLGSGDEARFSKLAAVHAIGLVASIAEIAGDECGVLFGAQGVRDPSTGRCSSPAADPQGQYQALIEGVLSEWGDAPEPLAWGLGDEPLTINAPEFRTYVEAWKTWAPGARLTAVVTWKDWGVYSTMGFDALSQDVYPFFRASGGYPTTPSQAYELLARKAVRTHPAAWMMGQAFSDEAWAFPSPEQVSWQAWSALASGARGFIAFSYRGPGSCSAACALLDDSSGTPLPTSQYEALAKAYRALGALSPILATAARDVPVFASIVRESRDSSLAVGLRDTNTGLHYVAVVAGYEKPGAVGIDLLLGPDITLLRRVSDGAAIPLSLSGGMRRAAITLEAGTGELYECTLDPANPPVVYFDDFSTDKFLVETRFHNIARFDDLINGEVLSATRGDDWPKDYIQLDLDSKLGSLAAGGLRVLGYDGFVVSDSGVRWYSSNDETAGFAAVSENRFESVVPVTQQYLKGSISWARASGFEYAFLSEMRLLQWKSRAERRPLESYIFFLAGSLRSPRTFRLF